MQQKLFIDDDCQFAMDGRRVARGGGLGGLGPPIARRLKFVL